MTAVFIAVLVVAYLLFLVAARYTPDEIFTTIAQDLAAIPASLRAGYEAALGVTAALCWLFGISAPSAFAAKFWRARARHAGKRLPAGERPARARAGAG